jgi:hypothetical protein
MKRIESTRRIRRIQPTRRIQRIRRAAATLTGLAVAWLGLAFSAPSAFAAYVPAGGDGWSASASGTVTPPPVVHVTRTIVAGGMPGWQIALIAAGAALLAAAVAVLADRARSARRPAVSAA